MKLLVSLIPAFLLNILAVASPIIEVKNKTQVTIIILCGVNFIMLKIKNIRNKTIVVENAPNKPSNVLLGETSLNILFFPYNLPKIYALESTTITTKEHNKKYGILD